MKKISLKNLNLKEVEQLSKEQLKNVFGGQEASVTCKCENGDSTTVECDTSQECVDRCVSFCG